jgi:hypothetical protein
LEKFFAREGAEDDISMPSVMQLGGPGEIMFDLKQLQRVEYQLPVHSILDGKKCFKFILACGVLYVVTFTSFFFFSFSSDFLLFL